MDNSEDIESVRAVVPVTLDYADGDSQEIDANGNIIYSTEDTMVLVLDGEDDNNDEYDDLIHDHHALPAPRAPQAEGTSVSSARGRERDAQLDLLDAPAQSEGRHNRHVLLQPSPGSPLQKERRPGHVENIFQGAQPMCGPHRVPRAFTVMHTLEYEALKTTPVVALECAGGNGREGVAGGETSRVCEGGGEADPRDATSKTGYKAENLSPAAEVQNYETSASHTDVKFRYRYEISTNKKEEVDQVRFHPLSSTTLHHPQGDVQGGAQQQDGHGGLVHNAQLVHDVGSVEPCVENTEGYGPTYARREGRDPAPGGQEGQGGQGCSDTQFERYGPANRLGEPRVSSDDTSHHRNPGGGGV